MWCKMSKSIRSTEEAEGYPSDDLPGAVTETELTEIQKQHSREFFACTNAVQHETQRAILTALVHNSGECTYEMIEPYSHVSQRTVRKHVGKLEEQNVVDRIDSRSYRIAFTSLEVRALAAHALECYL